MAPPRSPDPFFAARRAAAARGRMPCCGASSASSRRPVRAVPHSRIPAPAAIFRAAGNRGNSRAFAGRFSSARKSVFKRFGFHFRAPEIRLLPPRRFPAPASAFRRAARRLPSAPLRSFPRPRPVRALPPRSPAPPPHFPPPRPRICPPLLPPSPGLCEILPHAGADSVKNRAVSGRIL